MAGRSESITEPLLKNSNEWQLAEWAQDCYAGGLPREPVSASVDLQAVISGDEIRSAASSSSDLYPHAIHAPLLTPPQGPQLPQHVPQQSLSMLFGRGQGLDEVEIRELLIDHVGHRFCWGSMPARRWHIHAIEDCNSYVGTLETFIEEREVVSDVEPYMGGDIDGKDHGYEPGPWELDLRSEFPLLFVSRKEARVKVPHSEAVKKCYGCEGRKEVPCPMCNTNHEPGFYTANRMIVCSACQGRGLIAHYDGSDTKCENCKGEGKLACPSCRSRGLVKCSICRGAGSLLTRKICIVKWRTLLTRKVSASSNAVSVPDDVFHRARGVQVFNTQAYQCKPANFSDSVILNKFSSDIIADRLPVPPTARIICERHQITVVPVTRVIMAQKKRSFIFYIIGLSREVYIKDYPAQWCWGLCCCLN
eukprot:TRINITY_DN25625_c0_g1_i1.p1 TRINITY_DN25625_c0_g1~~TRINITY_DN25625_c0_g1_i1.p1  ORF type:complete len:420 (+),score=51.80 TRINITY_DN25625_c0_g1_i1:148-1407(+)